MLYQDLRDWIARVEQMGELQRVDGANVEKEIGAITAIARHQPSGPALLFDSIPGFAPGRRVLSNPMGSINRTALTMDMPLDLHKGEYVDIWRDRYNQIPRVAPRVVRDGPVTENVQLGPNVNVRAFPAPMWAEKDGGLFIGTGCAAITCDPDEGWVNLGTYRVQVLDEKRVYLYISPGRHGRIHLERWWAKGKPCPVAISVGHDPLTLVAASLDLGWGYSEYEYMGGLRGEPVEVIKGEITGLPIPARAELVLEGYMVPGNTGPEGPFGEWSGYYGSARRAEPIVDVQAIYHRHDPINMGLPPAKPPSGTNVYRCIIKSALVRDQLEKAGVPGVVGAWYHEPGAAYLFLAIAIKQLYRGHARQAGHIATFCGANSYMGRYIIVVDDDIDVTDLDDVMWAVMTRSDPRRSIDIIDRCLSGPLDPAIRPGEKGYNSRVVIDACRPYEWRHEFPEVVQLSPELKRETLEKWGHLFKGRIPARA